MPKRHTLTRILAIVGTVLAWLPIAATVLTSLVGSLASGVFRMDYLMPAELLPLALAGGVLLLAAALLARRHVKFFAWTFGAMIALLGAGMGLAELTGLASGRTEATGWRVGLVLTGVAGYIVALLALGVGGIRLVRELRRPAGPEPLS